jgi:hypothetical protein
MGAGDLLDRLCLLQSKAGMPEDRLSDGGDLDRAVGPLEDHDVELLLELLDLAAQGWLADKTSLRGTTEMACLGDG